MQLLMILLRVTTSDVDSVSMVQLTPSYVSMSHVGKVSEWKIRMYADGNIIFLAMQNHCHMLQTRQGVQYYS